MNDQQRAAMQMALEALEEAADKIYCQSNDDKIAGAITALREALAQPQCNQHPDAPHGFDRNASHNADRYVCECESWEQPQGKPVAWMWQHDETGRIGFVDVWQVENNWQENNPLNHLIKPLYTTSPSVEAAIEATLEKAAKVCEDGWKEGLGARFQGDVFAAAIRGVI